VKCNSDGASLGNPGNAAYGGIFRNSSSDFLGGFAINLGVSTALCSELIGAMVAIEIAYKEGWLSLCLETDVSFISFQVYQNCSLTSSKQMDQLPSLNLFHDFLCYSYIQGR